MEEFCSVLCDVDEKTEDKQEIEVDYFDELPDPIVVMILDRVYDARALCRCLAVSKRVASLVSEVGSVCISMNRPKPGKPIIDGSKSRNGSKSNLKNFVSRVLGKPMNFIQQMMLSMNMNSSKKMLNSSSSSSNGGFGSGVDIFKWVSAILKNFEEIESVSLELPCNGGEIGMNKNIPLLKWEASFGEVMEGCVIIGANSVLQCRSGSGSGGSRRSGSMFGSCNEGSNNEGDDSEDDEDEDEEDDHVFTDEELRLRIIWIISCLIASSGRHNLMKKMVGQCPKLRNAVISDAGGQGKLYMSETQIEELRSSMRIISTNHTNNNDQPPTASAGSGAEPAVAEGGAVSSTTQVGYVGNLVMKLWYVKELELPSSGQVMKGATLVVIKPENGKAVERNRGRMWGGFEGDKMFEEASKELLKRKEKRVYRLEVNSF